jgi:hydroxyethylthiazole kinase
MPAEGFEMHAPHSELPRLAADVLARLRARRPRVHCITNTVAQQFTANMLLAAGAIPSMTIAPEEVAGFVASADALLVNLGTFDAERRRAVEIALDAAAAKGLRWLLDPVLIDRSPPRADFARMLIARKPAAFRLNAAEFAALAGQPAEATAIAGFARGAGSVVAVSGATDLVSDGAHALQIANGHPFMGLVTAMGCAVSAIVTACLAVERDPFHATAAALLVGGVAGEIAGGLAAGPGSFAMHIIASVHSLDAAMLTARARVS